MKIACEYALLLRIAIPILLIIRGFRYIEDKSIKSLSVVTHDKLQWLEIINCHQITDEGLLCIKDMSGLRRLKLEDLKSVKNAELVLKELHTALPNCVIEYPPFTSIEEE